MQYLVWRLQRVISLLAAVVLYPVKLVLFIPVAIDRGIDRFLWRIGR